MSLLLILSYDPQPQKHSAQSKLNTALFYKTKNPEFTGSVSESYTEIPYPDEHLTQHPGITTTEHAALSTAHGIMWNSGSFLAILSLNYRCWRDDRTLQSTVLTLLLQVCSACVQSRLGIFIDLKKKKK